MDQHPVEHLVSGVQSTSRCARKLQKTSRLSQKTLTSVTKSTKYLQSRQSLKKRGPKYIGPFSIIKIINPVTVQLDLPKSLKCSLLKPAITSPLCPMKGPPPNSVLIEGELWSQRNLRLLRTYRKAAVLNCMERCSPFQDRMGQCPTYQISLTPSQIPWQISWQTPLKLTWHANCYVLLCPLC